MPDSTSFQYDGQAALTAVRELARTLVEKNVISAFDAQEVFSRAATLHAEAAAASGGDKLASEALLQCAAELGACEGI